MEEHRDFREFPYTVKSLGGAAKHLLVSGKAMFDDEGIFLGYRGAARDATEQRNAEEALKESEIRFKNIAESTSDWIWVTDESLRFSYISDRFYEITSLQPEDILGKTRQQFVGQEVIAQDPEKWAHYEELTKTRRRIREFDFCSSKADGSPLNIKINGSPYIKADGTFCGYQGTATDFTELKMAQEQLLRNEKLAALGGMVAGLSHEINTPVGNALTTSSFLRAEVTAMVESVDNATLTRKQLNQFLKETTETSSILEQNLGRAIELIENFKQVAVDQSSDQVRQFNLAEYIDAIVLSLQPVLKKGQCQIQVSCASHIEMYSEPGALDQVLTNLVMNSIIHGFSTEPQGERTIDISVTEQGQQLLLNYTDNGIGMQEQDLQRMFEPFYTTKRGEGSSGLGMHLVHGLVVESLHGTISCDSDPGNGVRFALKLPLSL